MSLKPIMTLLVDEEACKVQHNYFGYKRIDIIALNFDGKGGAIVMWDENGNLDTLHGIDLQHVLFGDPGTGVVWYKPVLANRSLN